VEGHPGAFEERARPEELLARAFALAVQVGNLPGDERAPRAMAHVVFSLPSRAASLAARASASSRAAREATAVASAARARASSMWTRTIWQRIKNARASASHPRAVSPAARAASPA
jgi:hypothetical protein